jgi:hypothetical protein
LIDLRRAGAGSAEVSEAGVTVGPMSHTCIWYEDDWPEHECDCGARAVLVIDDDGAATFAALDVAPARSAAREPLLISA